MTHKYNLRVYVDICNISITNNKLTNLYVRLFVT